MLLPVIVSSLFAALLAVTSYIPYKNHIKLHGANLDTQALSSANNLLNLQHCQPVSTRLANEPSGPTEPSFCEDVVLDHRTGLAYLSCDPTRLTWDARAGIYEDDGSSLKDEVGVPAIWAWDTTKQRLPRRLFISSPPPGYQPQAPLDLQETFHPLGIAVTSAHPYFLDEVENDEEPRPQPPANLVIVANHPHKDRPGVIDVFVHDLDKVGRKDHATLRWIKRIEGEDLRSRSLDSEERFVVNPFRIQVYAEQYSDPIPREYPEPAHIKDDPEHLAGFSHDDDASIAGRHVRIPSLLITSLPEIKDDDTSVATTSSSSVLESFWHPVASSFSSSYSKEAQRVSKQVFVHHSVINKTIGVRLDGGDSPQWVGFPPLIQTWDGNGKKGGANSSAAAIFMSSLTSDKSKVQEWEQHWVRGIPQGIREYRVHPSDPASQEGRLTRVLKTYTPSFVNFFAADQETPVRALVVDKIGRLWTAGNPSTKAVEKWIASQRAERRRRLGLTGSKALLPSSDRPPRPASRIDQTTFVYRHFGSVIAHPWDFEKLATMKKKGIWLKKEYHTFPVFKTPDENQAELEARSEDELKQRGFLPTVPTGMAIDTDRKLLFVAGAYDERGIAQCKLPTDWIEK